MSRRFGENNMLDENLRNFFITNTSNQTIRFISFLNEASVYPLEKFPQMKERYALIEVKPGKSKVIPHKYYKVHTRDGSPATFEMGTMNEATEALANSTLKKGFDQQEHG